MNIWTFQDISFLILSIPKAWIFCFSVSWIAWEKNKSKVLPVCDLSFVLTYGLSIPSMKVDAKVWLPITEDFIWYAYSAISENFDMYSWIEHLLCFKLDSLCLAIAALEYSENLSLSLILIVSHGFLKFTTSWVYTCRGPFEVAAATSLHVLSDSEESLDTLSSQF